MTRILYWNIEKFGENKIASTKRKRQTGSTLSSAQASTARANYMNTHWAITDALNAAAPLTLSSWWSWRRLSWRRATS